jgi:hypothetical protein
MASRHDLVVKRANAVAIKSLALPFEWESENAFAEAESSTLLARVEELKRVAECPRLARYVEVVQGRLGRVFLFSEHWECSVRQLLGTGASLPEQRVRRIAHGTLEALCFLRSMGVVVSLVFRMPVSFVLCSECSVELACPRSA